MLASWQLVQRGNMKAFGRVNPSQQYNKKKENASAADIIYPLKIKRALCYSQYMVKELMVGHKKFH